MSNWWAKIWGISKGRIRLKGPNRGRLVLNGFLAVLMLISPALSGASGPSDDPFSESGLGWRKSDPRHHGVPAVNTAGSETKRERPNKIFMNPDGTLDCKGIPSLTDIFEFFANNPDQAMEMIQDPGQWPYLTVAAGMIACRDLVKAEGGRPVPDRFRRTLRRWYPDDLLNTVRWTTMQETMRQFLKDARMNFADDTLAVTVIDVVIFRDDKLAEDGALWAHELFHVQQYGKWGVFGFARKWVENSSVHGPVEAPAYARGAEARPYFSH